MNTTVRELYKDYICTRNKSIDQKQFMYLLKLFPSMLVCLSDDILNTEEWKAMEMVSEGLALEIENDIDNKDDLSRSIRAEIRYLMNNLDRWKKRFHSALFNHLNENPTDKEFVRESMYLFANIADGISKVEQESIHQLSHRLNIAN